MKKDVYIFGRGGLFKEQIKELLLKYKIKGFLDNAVSSEEYDEIYSCYAYNPQKLVTLDKYPIVIAAKSFIEMYFQLKELGIEDERIIFEIKNPNIIIVDGMLAYRNKKNEVNCFDSYEKLDIERRNNAIIGDFLAENFYKINNMPMEREFGTTIGTAVDRYYIEQFLKCHEKDIEGVVMEVGINEYTRKFGKEKVIKSIVAHVEGWNNMRLINLESGDGVKANEIDCYICTQVLQYIFDLESAFLNIYKMLKPGGCALITVPGIKSLCSPDDDKWGEYWSFTEKSLEKLCSKVSDDYQVYSFGNVKSVIAYLYGIPMEMMDKKDLEVNDKKYPFLITAKLRKRR